MPKRWWDLNPQPRLPRGLYIVWVKEDGRWEPNGEGPLTLKQAERIAKETRQDTGVPTQVLPVGQEPVIA